jgi:hypothetical protein
LALISSSEFEEQLAPLNKNTTEINKKEIILITPSLKKLHQFHYRMELAGKFFL